MSFDKIFDLTAGVYFHFYNIRSLIAPTTHDNVFWQGGEHRPYTPYFNAWQASKFSYFRRAGFIFYLSRLQPTRHIRHITIYRRSSRSSYSCRYEMLCRIPLQSTDPIWETCATAVDYSGDAPYHRGSAFAARFFRPNDRAP